MGRKQHGELLIVLLPSLNLCPSWSPGQLLITGLDSPYFAGSTALPKSDKTKNSAVSEIS